MLKPKEDKLEWRLEVCQFVDYPKETRFFYYFYIQDNQKVLVCTRLLEDDIW